MFRVCKKCNVPKNDIEFYSYGNGRFRGACKQCTKESVKTYKNNHGKKKIENYTKSYYEKNREKILEKQKTIRQNRAVNGDKTHALYMKKYQSNPVNRAKWLHKRAMMRSIGKYEDFSLSLERVVRALENGICEKTGLTFDFEPHKKYHYNPFSPSIDRKNSEKGYTDENCQIVCTAYNLAKSEMTDQELFFICKKIVNFAENKGS